jgi:cell wall-associated NlpC family hydrolase
MKSKMNIKSIVIMAAVGIISLFFINMSLAANTGKINVDTANLRETADENAKILEQISIGEEVEIIEKTGDWYQVKVKGITGYIRQDLITVNGEIEENNVISEDETTAVTTSNQETVTTTSKEEIELGKQKVAEDTKLKIVPVINATDIVEVKKDEEVNVIEIVNGWVCVETQTTKGWIRKEKLETIEEQAEESSDQTTEETESTETTTEVLTQESTVSKILYVNTASTRLRKEANTSSEIITNLSVNTEVEVIKEEDGWSQVKVNGDEGYISSSLLSSTKQETSRSSTTPRTATEENAQANTTTQETNNTATTTTSSASSGNGSSIVATAQQYIGCSYVYGGSTPSGFDCSGFTSYIYKLYGITLSRTAAGQYSNGVAVSKSDLQPGDLVMFGPSGISHVGIYIGGGMMVHAANSSRGVTTDTINSGYYNTNYVGARRVI